MMLDLIMNCLRRVPVRGKGRFLGGLIPKRGVRSAVVFGSNIQLDLSDLIQRGIYVGCYENEETQWVRRSLGPGKTFVDVGANIGYFTLLAASLVGPRGRVLAIEPNPQLIPRLSQFVNSNGLNQVVVVGCGVSDREDELTLHVPPASFGNNNATLLMWDGLPGWERCKVKVDRLDVLLKANAVGPVDLLKIDVEGHEDRAIRSLGNRLCDGSVRRIMCEFNEPALKAAGNSSAELYQLLLDSGYEDSSVSPFSKTDWLQNRLFLHRGAKNL